jgi:hypothetical protein
MVCLGHMCVDTLHKGENDDDDDDNNNNNNITIIIIMRISGRHNNVQNFLCWSLYR